MAVVDSARPVTIYTVARRAGVSISTVSRVLQGSTPTSEETRNKVLRAVDELGYVPLRARTNLLRLETHGLVMPAVGGPYYSEILSGYQLAAGQYGLSVMLVSAEAKPEHLTEQVIDLCGKVDGMMIMHATVPDDVIMHVASRVPVALTGRDPLPGCDYVGVENVDATAALVRHVIAHGARRPRFVGITETRDVRQRYAGYLQAVAEAGLEVPVAGYKVPAVEEFGNQVAQEVVEEDPRCDALICANDELALAVMKALARRGLRTPDDIIITGFDDIMPARYTLPGLTTVRQPTRLLGSLLAQRLHERISLGSPCQEPTTLSCEVVIRGSCGCPEI